MRLLSPTLAPTPALWLTLLVSLPLPALAAEALSNAGMSKDYVPSGPSCKDKEDKLIPCEASGSRSVTDKAQRDAERQGTAQALENPVMGNPEARSIPRDIVAPPDLTPQQLQIQQQLIKDLSPYHP